MGEIADSVMRGEMCEYCGEWLKRFLNTDKGYGYPVICFHCYKELDKEERVRYSNRHE